MVVSDGGSARCKVYSLGSSLSRHLHNLLGGGTSDNGVVYEQNGSAVKLGHHGVELSSNRRLSLLLVGHDESSANISVLDETLSVRDLQLDGTLESSMSRSIGNGDNHVNLLKHLFSGSESCNDVVSKLSSHSQTRSVDGNTVHDRIWSGKVHVLENVRGVRLLGDNLSEDGLSAILLNDNSLSRLDVHPLGEAKGLQSHGLGREHVVLALTGSRGSRTNHQGSDSMRVSETDETVASHHSSAGISSSALSVDATKGSEDILGVDSDLVMLLQLGGEDIQKQLGVGISVNMSVNRLVKVVSQSRGVDKVTVVGHDQSIRRVDVERLSLGVGEGAGSGVSQMSNAHASDQTLYTGLGEDVPDHTVALALIQSTPGTGGNDTTGVLSSVLEEHGTVQKLSGGHAVVIGQKQT
jgi:hypothetical protein